MLIPQRQSSFHLPLVGQTNWLLHSLSRSPRRSPTASVANRRLLASGVRPPLSPALTASFSACSKTQFHFHRSRNWRMSMSASSVSTATSTPVESIVGEERATEGNGAEDVDVVVQYVVLRRDLIESWPLGSVVTQGCHASVAAIWEHKDDPHTLIYCNPPNLDSMHKVTLEVKGEPQIVNLSEKLKASGISHKLWIEQPEKIPTCLATKPYPKSIVSPFFKKLKLCK